MSQRWPATLARRGRFFSVPATPPPTVPVWVSPFIRPARRPLLPTVRRGQLIQMPLGNFGPHETLWRLGTPGNGWQFGTPVIS